MKNLTLVSLTLFLSHCGEAPMRVRGNYQVGQTENANPEGKQGNKAPNSPVNNPAPGVGPSPQGPVASIPNTQAPTPGITPGMQETPAGNMPVVGQMMGPDGVTMLPLPLRGAGVPWIEYEAEDSQFQGELQMPSRKIGEFAAESSGRKSVKLSKVGDFVSVKSKAAGNSIVVRLAIPDSGDGKGIDATLGIYINGKRVKSLPATSRFSWLYGDESHPGNSPGGIGRRMFDESRALIEDFPAGAEIKVQKDGEDKAEYYVVDLIDLEKVAAPLKKPEGFLSITDFGAVANDNKDDFDALQKALNEGNKQKKGVWIPEGHFWFDRRFDNTGLNVQTVVDDTEVRGAGMWYSNLDGPGITFACGGNACKYYNFAINGGTSDRVDVNRADNGFNDGAGKDSVLDGIWVEHTKVGFWVGKHHKKRADGLKSVNLQIRNSRFRNLYADGVNLANGTSNSIIENSHFRYTGDDSIAMWSQLGEQPSPDPNGSNNIIRHNTVQLPWRATCFAFYGSKDLQLLNNICADTLTYPGFFAAGTFAPHHPFEGNNVVKEMSLVRTGGPFYANQFHGALKLFGDSGISVENFSFENIDIIDSTYSGIQIEGAPEFKNISFKNVKISGSGTDGIRIMASARNGKIKMENVVVEGSMGKALNNETMLDAFLEKGAGNIGW